MANILPNEIPRRFMVPPADVVLFYCEKDEVEAKVLVKRIDTAAILAGEDIRVYLYDNDEVFCSEDSEFQSIDAVTSLVVEIWFLVTDSFIDDLLLQCYKDEALMKAILEPSKRNSVVPVFDKPKEDFLEIPYGLASFRGLYLQDSNLAEKVLRRFKLPRHRALKENLMKKQEQNKSRWLEIERVRRCVDTSQASAKPSKGDYHKKLDNIIRLLERLNHVGCGSTSDANDDVESEIPEYLHHSLNSIRSQQSHTTVYHITINQPRSVVVA